jgi:serine protease Do
LINLDGEVIAVNAMIEGYENPITGFTVNRGVGLAIPINEARMVKDRLIKEGKFTRSIIGVYPWPESRDMLNILTMEGVRVARLSKDSPAEKAGLKTNDVIIAVDGAPVRTFRDLRNEVGFKKPGQSITVTVKRDNGGKPLPFKMITEAEAPPPEESLVSINPGRPSPGPRTPQQRAPEPGTPEPHSPELDYGFSVKALTGELAAQYGVDSTSGVMITDVLPFGQAYQRDIEPGDIITKMNNKNISSMKDFDAALKRVGPADSFTMYLKLKDGSEAFKVLKDPRPPVEQP